MIKTVSGNQHDIIKDIILLHNGGEGFDLDPTYSSGKFYSKGGIPQPKIKSDIISRFDNVHEWDAKSLDLPDNSVQSIMFDPPFVAGHTKDKPSGIIGERFHGFRYIPELWKWYEECLDEFSRVLSKGGILVFKCQDTVSSGKQWWSHIHIVNEAQKRGFYCKDLFVLTAKNRIVGHNHANQKHARKFHSYFLVFELRGVK